MPGRNAESLRLGPELPPTQAALLARLAVSCRLVYLLWVLCKIDKHAPRHVSCARMTTRPRNGGRRAWSVVLGGLGSGLDPHSENLGFFHQVLSPRHLRYFRRSGTIPQT